MRKTLHFLTLLLLIISIGGCAKPRSVKLPPVTEGWQKPSSARNAYIVQEKDTLYSIAWAFGVDYRYLAELNNIKAPYALRRGQRLHINPLSSRSSVKYQTKSPKPLSELRYSVMDSSTKPLSGWIWPTAGKVVAKFNNKLGGNKGIDIVGGNNQPVLACNHGIVVYSGTGIRSYGKLIIIKHSDDYLSAYAYNQEMLVSEGQEVKARQKIAIMGKDNDGKTALHFEIRRFGKPVDPLLYLPRKS